MFSNNLTAEKSSSHGNVSDILFPSGPFPKGAQFGTSILLLPLRDNIPHGPMDAPIRSSYPQVLPLLFRHLASSAIQFFSSRTQIDQQKYSILLIQKLECLFPLSLQPQCGIRLGLRTLCEKINTSFNGQRFSPSIDCPQFSFLNNTNHKDLSTQICLIAAKGKSMHQLNRSVFTDYPKLRLLIIITLSHSTMQNEGTRGPGEEIDECINKINQLTSHVKLLSKEHKLQQLEELLLTEQYLGLLANSLYAVNSVAYSYSSLKNTPFPQEFAKLQEYFRKAKNPLAGQQNPQVVVDKQAASRIIASSTK